MKNVCSLLAIVAISASFVSARALHPSNRLAVRFESGEAAQLYPREPKRAKKGSAAPSGSKTASAAKSTGSSKGTAAQAACTSGSVPASNLPVNSTTIAGEKRATIAVRKSRKGSAANCTGDAAATTVATTKRNIAMRTFVDELADDALKTLRHRTLPILESRKKQKANGTTSAVTASTTDTSTKAAKKAAKAAKKAAKAASEKAAAADTATNSTLPTSTTKARRANVAVVGRANLAPQ